MTTKGCPCQGCEDRFVGCHAECERYAAWKERRREQWHQLQESIAGAREFGGFRRSTYEKARRKYKFEKGLHD